MKRSSIVRSDSDRKNVFFNNVFESFSKMTKVDVKQFKLNQSAKEWTNLNIIYCTYNAVYE
jgi:hypothetical protein